MIVQELRPRHVAAAIVAMAALGGCSRQAEQPAATTNVSFENMSEEESPAVEAEQATAPEPANASASDDERPVVPPEEPISQDAQMLDDADASGMTARLPDHAEEAPAGNDSQEAPRQR